MRTAKEIRELEISERLQAALGEEYEVRYDLLESGLTYFYYNLNGRKIHYKTALNTDMVPHLSVTKYVIPRELREAIYSGYGPFIDRAIEGIDPYEEVRGR